MLVPLQQKFRCGKLGCPANLGRMFRKCGCTQVAHKLQVKIEIKVRIQKMLILLCMPGFAVSCTTIDKRLWLGYQRVCSSLSTRLLPKEIHGSATVMTHWLPAVRLGLICVALSTIAYIDVWRWELSQVNSIVRYTQFDVLNYFTDPPVLIVREWSSQVRCKQDTT